MRLSVKQLLAITAALGVTFAVSYMQPQLKRTFKK
jgi:hypothetical protein